MLSELTILPLKSALRGNTSRDVGLETECGKQPSLCLLLFLPPFLQCIKAQCDSWLMCLSCSSRAQKSLSVVHSSFSPLLSSPLLSLSSPLLSSPLLSSCLFISLFLWLLLTFWHSHLFSFLSICFVYFSGFSSPLLSSHLVLSVALLFFPYLLIFPLITIHISFSLTHLCSSCSLLVLRDGLAE